MEFNDFKALVIANRSCRRFDASRAIEHQELADLVDLARQTASAANMQPLKYVTCRDPETNQQIYDCLGWAAYLKDWKGPEESERPAGYIVILGDTSVASKFWCDHGITSQTMLLGARAMGLGGCIFASINKKKLKDILQIADHLEVMLVVAIGTPVETAVIDPINPGDSIKYYRDESQVHHVPKRKLEDILIRSW
mgnify:CR=1 FL=1